jgi:hypothetical protein
MNNNYFERVESVSKDEDLGYMLTGDKTFFDPELVKDADLDEDNVVSSSLDIAGEEEDDEDDDLDEDDKEIIDGSYGISFLNLGMIIFYPKEVESVPFLVDDDGILYINDVLTQLWDTVSECTPETISGTMHKFIDSIMSEE